jgi:hypothetical protein
LFNLGSICPNSPPVQDVQFIKSGNTYTYEITAEGSDGSDCVTFINTVTCNPSATTPEDKWTGTLTASCGTITWGSSIEAPTMNKPGSSNFTWNGQGCPKACCPLDWYCVSCS